MKPQSRRPPVHRDAPAHRDDPARWPALGRALHRAGRPGNALGRGVVLAVACAIVLTLDFGYEKHGKLAAETLPGFFAIAGFAGAVALVLLARLLRHLAGRRAAYYAPHSVDAEDYPAAGLERRNHDG